jgi:hypothetical protein
MRTSSESSKDKPPSDFKYMLSSGDGSSKGLWIELRSLTKQLQMHFFKLKVKFPSET